jgi:hypothetical protein
VIDYAKLAGYAKVVQENKDLAGDSSKGRSEDPHLFFGKVKQYVQEEMKKANAELIKRKAAVIGWNHLPGFDDEIFLTYGTDTMCRVVLRKQSGVGMITAILSGPPNGYEISRKIYPCDEEANLFEAPAGGQAAPQKVKNRPREIAGNIIFGILVGSFD